MRELETREMEAIVSKHNGPEEACFCHNPMHHQVEKLIEEAGEVGTAIDEGDVLHITQELGDVLIVLLDICNRQGVTLQQAFEAAMTKNMIRYNGVIRQGLEQEGYYGWEAYQEAKRRNG